MNKLILALAMLFLATGANASTYNFNMSVGTSTYSAYPGNVPTIGAPLVTVTGSLQTDGTLGALGAANIIGWAFTATTNGFTRSWASTDATGSSMTYFNGAFVASSNALSYDPNVGGQTIFKQTAPATPTWNITTAYLYFWAPWNTGPNVSAGVLDFAANSGGGASLTAGGRGTTFYTGAGPYQIASIAAVPLPAAGALYGGALLGMGWFARRRKRQSA